MHDRNMQDSGKMDRRHFLQRTAAGASAAAVGGSMLQAESPKKPPTTAPETKVDPAKLIWRSKKPTMDYRRLGRTNYMVSRIVAGIGGNDMIWRRMMDRGMNYFDTAACYLGGNHEIELGRLFRAFRDDLWITTKPSDVAGFSKIDEEVRKLYLEAMKDFLGKGEGDLLGLHKQAIEKQKKTGEKPDLRPAGKRMARLYTEKLDESLTRKMRIDHVDCYMMHGVEIPWMFDCPEVWEAHEKAHKTGKVKHFGISVHKHHKDVLAAVVEANKRGPWKIDLVMAGVNPESFDHFKPELTALKKQDVGIIAMKTSGIKNRPMDGREAKFKSLMGGKSYNEWERAKLWMLHLTEGLIDGCIAVMTSNKEMEKDLALPMVKLSAQAERELRAMVKLEMAGSCTLCGRCETNCPQHIAVTDMIRYHAYIYQYDEKDLARRLYAQAGYDPAEVCNNCGACAEVCPANVPITALLRELSADLA